MVLDEHFLVKGTGMDIQTASFVLAIVIGMVCFGLVQHTAAEFDHWYEDGTA